MSGRLGRTTLIYFLTQVGSTLAGGLATWYINVKLGAGAFGEYSTAVALLFWLTIPSSALGEAVKKRISEGTDSGAFLAAGHAVNLGFHVVVVGGLLAFRRQVNVFVGADVAVFFAFLVAMQALFDLMLSSLRGYKQVSWSGGIKTFERVSRSLIQIGLLFFLGASVAGLVLGHGVALLLAVGVGIAVLDGAVERPGTEHVSRLGEYAQFAWLGTLKTRAFAWTDVMVMRGLSLSIVGLAAVSKEQIGIYKVAWTLASTLALVSISIKTTLFPELSELGVEEDFDQVRHLLEEGLAYAGLFAIPGLFGAAVLGETLLTLFGAEHAAGGTILVILIASRLFASFGNQLVAAINAIDHPDVAFRVHFAYVVANISLNFVLITLFGWYGAAFATALASLANVLLAGYAVSSLIGRPAVPVGELGRQLVASLVMFTVVAGAWRFVPRTLAWAFGLVTVGGAVYGTVILGLSARLRSKATSMVWT